MIYNSTLRAVLTLPEYQPEINNAADVISNGIETIYVGVPERRIRVRYQSFHGEEILQKVLSKFLAGIYKIKKVAFALSMLSFSLFQCR